MTWDLPAGPVARPLIPNFPHFGALRLGPDVPVRVARARQVLEGADAVILPGSRNVFTDM
ncbi:hypothetical protein DSECCO2_660140 [anaerobic digester metagenome]